MTNNSEPRGLWGHILGSQPTKLQTAFCWLMALSLLMWPLFSFGAIFFFDSSIHSSLDGFCRYGMAYTIWLYPVYIFLLMRIFFRLSKRLRIMLPFYLCPLIPIGVFCLFWMVDTSEYASQKPYGYDASTFKRLNEAYATDVNHVYYNNSILRDAAPATFRAIDNDYAVDSRHVWFDGDSIAGAHPATFVVPAKNSTLRLAHDDHDYYIGRHPLYVADMSTFKYKDGNWAVDSKFVYYLEKAERDGKGKVPVGDYRTFRVLHDFYAADAKNVYFQDEVVEGADPQSFSVMKGQYHYGQDKNRVYCQAYGSPIRDFNALKHKNMDGSMWDAFHTDGTTVYNPELKPMPVGTDFATIHKVEPNRDWYADKAHVYYENRLLPQANPKTFKVFPSHYLSETEVSDINKSFDYSHDGTHVYYRDSLMNGVDLPTFICGHDWVEDQSFAFDKNRYYEGTPSQRHEVLR